MDSQRPEGLTNGGEPNPRPTLTDRQLGRGAPESSQRGEGFRNASKSPALSARRQKEFGYELPKVAPPTSMSLDE